MGHRWDVIGRHVAISGSVGALKGAALGSLAAGAGALPGAGVGAAVGMARGVVTGMAQLAHEEFLTNMAKHRADKIRAGKHPGALGELRRYAAPKTPAPANAHHAAKPHVPVGTGAKSLTAAISAAKAKSPSMAHKIKNAQFEAKHRRVHGKFA